MYHVLKEEIPRVFDCWSYWLAEAGLCGDIKEVSCALGQY
jgi:hypothetical protein